MRLSQEVSDQCRVQSLEDKMRRRNELRMKTIEIQTILGTGEKSDETNVVLKCCGGCR